MDILIRYLHLLAIIVLAGALIIENIAISSKISREDVRNLVKVDAIYGISAAVVLLCGLALWLWVGKPAGFYTANPIFHAKLGLFLLVGLLSLYPTLFLLRQRKSSSELIIVPPMLIRILRLELILFAIIPVLAFLMARGVGL
jgi:putative membrane protein